MEGAGDADAGTVAIVGTKPRGGWHRDTVAKMELLGFQLWRRQRKGGPMAGQG